MSDREKLIERVEFFYSDIIEPYKEIQMQVIRESKLRTMFKKANYDERIDGFKKCKKMALQMDTKDIRVDKDDEDSVKLKANLERCLVLFNSMCDGHISMQDFLKKKATPKSGVKVSDYKRIMELVRSRNVALQMELHNLDVIYADYVEDDYDDCDEEEFWDDEE